MGNLTPAQRHKNMRNTKSKDTNIEMLLRKELWKRGYRYRKNYSKLPGNPDIVLTKYRIAIFCDGEIFHGKDWEDLRPKLETVIMEITGFQKSHGILNVLMKSIRCF